MGERERGGRHLPEPARPVRHDREGRPRVDPIPPSPILRRRRLGSELRQLREAAGLTGDQVIERIGRASASKLSRLENGRSRPDLRDVHDLLDLYQADESTRRDLAAITGEAGDMRGWLRSYPVMTPSQRGYAELEAGCADIREYSPVIVPGLLQTAGYARVRIVSSRPLMMATAEGAAGDPDTEVAARMARQTLLGRQSEPLRYAAVIEEAALGPRSAPAAVVRGQLLRLRELAASPHITLQILPQHVTINEWFLPQTAFSLYRFADPQDPETLAIEGISTNMVLTDRDEFNRYSTVFEWLQAAALSPGETSVWLTEAAERLRSPRRPPALPPTQRSGDREQIIE